MVRADFLAVSLIFQVQPAVALDAFACVRDLLPISTAASFQIKREAVESPFMAAADFIVFPEIEQNTLSGFFVYSATKASYFDTVQSKQNNATPRPLSELLPTAMHTLYEMVAQPDGLETLTLQYLPGFETLESTHSGPVFLGSSLLPVIGAFVSRSGDSLRQVYNNPVEAGEGSLKKWIYGHTTRKPATAEEIQIRLQLMTLSTLHPKSPEQIREPLQNELKLRKRWLQSHNLDEAAFKKLTHAMETTCRE